MAYIGKNPTSVPLTSSDITDGIISLPKLTDGTDGNLISYDASGNPVAVATGNDGQVLTSTGAGSPPAFETPASATNTPAFSAYSSADRVISNNTATLVAANAENFDTDSAYDTSTYKFTPGVAGKYFLYFRYFYTGTFTSTIRGYIYKNGTDVAHNDFTHVQSDNGGMISTIVTSDTDDYFQAYTYQNSGSSRSTVGGSRLIEFGGYKLIS
jgi:hypothetical protein